MLPPAYVNAFSLCCSVASLFIVHQSTHAMNKRAEKGETILGGIIFSWKQFLFNCLIATAGLIVTRLLDNLLQLVFPCICQPLTCFCRPKPRGERQR
ncbi:hypothetical protein ECG_05126 [Echinococcus granulosus]|uniref:Secreted protein n=1 Tax=Echinococcus granulosus TaxID=6210 RepID=A0A068X456_ECHGR|nr:hypothetical protein ECG_05126 [Echinococcus granulosus]CDS24716.1 hypothetical protein EgrG_000283600 [Echinococcus granulosus]